MDYGDIIGSLVGDQQPFLRWVEGHVTRHFAAAGCCSNWRELAGGWIDAEGDDLVPEADRGIGKAACTVDDDFRGCRFAVVILGHSVDVLQRSQRATFAIPFEDIDG